MCKAGFSKALVQGLCGNEVAIVVKKSKLIIFTFKTKKDFK